MRRGDYELFPNSKYPEHKPSAQHKPSAGPPDMHNFCNMEDYQRALDSWRRSEEYDITKDDESMASLFEKAKHDKGAYDTLKELGYDVAKNVGGAR